MIKHKKIEISAFYYGFPVLLATTTEPITNKHNITPLSSSFALADKIYIGISTQGKCFANIQAGSDIILNIPDASLLTNIQLIEKFTNQQKVPSFQQELGYTYCDDKFKLAKLTPEHSNISNTVKIKECPIQVETKLDNIINRGAFAVIELTIINIYVNEKLLDNSGKLDSKQWNPLIYKFREYDTTTEPLGFNFRY